MAKDIKGSTTIQELMEMFPDGRAVKLMGALGWPCACCGARETEALSLAAKRHGNPPQAVIAAFRALSEDSLDDDTIAAATRKKARKSNPGADWSALAARYGNPSP